MKYVVPMLESERGWGAKIDGYAGPFDTLEAALEFQSAFNLKHNSETVTPDWYIVARDPVEHCGQECVYKSVV